MLWPFFFTLISSLFIMLIWCDCLEVVYTHVQFGSPCLYVSCLVYTLIGWSKIVKEEGLISLRSIPLITLTPTFIEDCTFTVLYLQSRPCQKAISAWQHVFNHTFISQCNHYIIIIIIALDWIRRQDVRWCIYAEPFQPFINYNNKMTSTPHQVVLLWSGLFHRLLVNKNRAQALCTAGQYTTEAIHVLLQKL